MQVQKIQNNNYNTIRYQSTNTKNVSFGERMKRWTLSARLNLLRSWTGL